ncbi:hypothetical protein P4O66_021773, partial [Electrophorus voltai]
SSNQSSPIHEYPDCRDRASEPSLLVSPLVVAGIVIGLVLFLSCVTIIVGSLRKDSRLRNPHLPSSYGIQVYTHRWWSHCEVVVFPTAPDAFSYGGSVGELRSSCLDEFPPAFHFDSYLETLSQINIMYPDSPPQDSVLVQSIGCVWVEDRAAPSTCSTTSEQDSPSLPHLCQGGGNTTPHASGATPSLHPHTHLSPLCHISANMKGWCEHRHSMWKYLGNLVPLQHNGSMQGHIFTTIGYGCARVRVCACVRTYEECVGPAATQIYVPTDDPPPYSLTDPCHRDQLHPPHSCLEAQELPASASWLSVSGSSQHPIRLQDWIAHPVASISLSATPLEEAPPYEAVVREQSQPLPQSQLLPLLPMDLLKHTAEESTPQHPVPHTVV